MLKLSFWGAAGTVTGSKYLIETERARVLVDCGLFQGLKELRELNWTDPPFDPAALDACLITHAHIDHIGYLPRLVARGFSGPIYCTRATAELLRISLLDAARLQEEEADYRNRHGLTSHTPALPLYTEEDARAVFDLLRAASNDGTPVEAARGIGASFRVAGHILGASHILVEAEGVNAPPLRVLFSGDLGRLDQPIIRPPAPPPACDYLLLESTYGDQLHDRTPPKDLLAAVINEAAESDAPLLIPSFAIGRTQEILYLIRELEDEGRIPVLRVRVDSPMANAITQIYQNRSEEQDEEYRDLVVLKRRPLHTQSMLIASSREESKRLNEERGARIIISSSGMMTGGRVLHHAMRILPDERAIICFVGYQAAGTTGRKILDGAREVKIMKEMIPVRCRVRQISSLSAHADYEEMLAWLSGLERAPRTIFLTHGEPHAAEALRAHIAERFGWRAETASYGQTVALG